MNQINIKLDVGHDKYCNDCPVVRWEEGNCPLFDEYLEVTFEPDELGWVNKKLFRCAKCLAAKVEETKLQPKFKPGDKVYITEYRYNSETCDLDRNEIEMTIKDVVIENNTILYITNNNPFVKTEEKYFHLKQE